LAAKVFARNIDVLGRHLEARALAHGMRIVETGRDGDHHPAPGDLQVDRLVETFTAVLEEDILAGDAEVGSPVLHIGRGVGSADDDHATFSRLVGMISRREVSGSSSGSIPAAASRGRVSSKIRPFDRAMVMPFTAVFPARQRPHSTAMQLSRSERRTRSCSTQDKGRTRGRFDAFLKPVPVPEAQPKAGVWA
jgi:hypothetical protein